MDQVLSPLRASRGKQTLPSPRASRKMLLLSFLVLPLSAYFSIGIWPYCCSRQCVEGRSRALRTVRKRRDWLVTIGQSTMSLLMLFPQLTLFTICQYAWPTTRYPIPLTTNLETYQRTPTTIPFSTSCYNPSDHSFCSKFFVSLDQPKRSAVIIPLSYLRHPD